MRVPPALVLLALLGCSDKAADSGLPQGDSGQEDGADRADGGSDGSDGADGTDPAYERFEGYHTLDVYGPLSDRPDLCQLTWLLSGVPATSTCATCSWSFFVSASYDEALSAEGACGEPSDFTVTYATDGETLFYEYGGSFVPLGSVTAWDPEAPEANFFATGTVENLGYTYVSEWMAEVR